MTIKDFNKGYKLLMRFLKDIGRYPDFKRITAKNNPQFKKKLFFVYNNHSIGKYYSWEKFFDYTCYVGDDYEQYNDQGLNTFRTKWQAFLYEQWPEYFKL